MAKNSRSSSKKNTPVNTPTKKNPKINNTKKSPKVNNKKKTVSKDNSVIPEARIIKAIEELEKYNKKKSEEKNESGKKDLLDDDEDSFDDLKKNVQLIAINNKSFTGNNKVFKPKMFTIPNSLYKPWKQASETLVKDFKTLLIVKDQDIATIRENEDDILEKLEESGVKIDEIICGKDLKTVYKAYESRRAFVSEFSLILADDSIVASLPKLLGGKAYNKVDTTPIAIRTQSNSKKVLSLETLMNSIKKVYLTQLPALLPRGTTLNIHLGNLTWFKSTELAQNVTNIAEKLLDTYSIRTIFIKTNDSPVLPLYYNDAVLDEIVAKVEKASSTENKTVNIDGVEVSLSNFDRALLEITNPDETSEVFAKQINSAKRQLEEDDEEEEKKPKTSKKIKA